MKSWHKPHTVLTCKDCASGIANDDWSWVDYHPSSSEVMARIEGALEKYGYLSHLESVEVGLHYDCAICGEVNRGPGDDPGSAEVFVTKGWFEPTPWGFSGPGEES